MSGIKDARLVYGLNMLALSTICLVQILRVGSNHLQSRYFVCANRHTRERTCSSEVSLITKMMHVSTKTTYFFYYVLSRFLEMQAQRNQFINTF